VQDRDRIKASGPCQEAHPRLQEMPNLECGQRMQSGWIDLVKVGGLVWRKTASWGCGSLAISLLCIARVCAYNHLQPHEYAWRAAETRHRHEQGMQHWVWGGTS
jgi:hypothetical protein